MFFGGVVWGWLWGWGVVRGRCLALGFSCGMGCFWMALGWIWPFV